MDDDFDRFALLVRLYPEQMRRDPSGHLASLTDQARRQSNEEGRSPQLTYVHGGPCGRAVLAQVGRTEHGILYAAPMQRYSPRDIGEVIEGGPFSGLVRVPVRPGEAEIVLPPEGTPTRSGQGVTAPAGVALLVVEPPGFPPPPSQLPMQCSRCGSSLTIARSRVVADLRSGAMHKVHR